jgi:chitinase
VLAVALSGYKEVIDQAYDLAAIGRYVEFMSVMSYDYHGAWEKNLGHVSPLYYRNGDQFPQYNTVCLHFFSMADDTLQLLFNMKYFSRFYSIST